MALNNNSTKGIFLTLCACCVIGSHAWVLSPNETLSTGERCSSDSNELAHRIELCAKPLMDLIQGTIEKWPKDTNGVKDLCTSFGKCEKCIRENSRKCAVGLKKQITSTVASSIQKARKSECVESKLPALLKTTQCFERNQNIVHGIMSNVTSYLSVIENDFKDLDAKTNAVCCLVNDLDSNISRPLDKVCPEESKVIVRVIKLVLADALNLICRSPRCNGIFKGYKIKQMQTNRFNGFIEIILRIVFTLG